ncbi:hypothetical protein AVEN_176796-1, partial [Araneus ventricosus]
RAFISKCPHEAVTSCRFFSCLPECLVLSTRLQPPAVSAAVEQLRPKVDVGWLHQERALPTARGSARFPRMGRGFTPS